MGKSKKRIQSYIIDKEKIIGKGAFGEVYLCEHQATKSIYVAKVIDKHKIQSDVYMKNALKQQIQIHKSLKHKNIVEVLDVFETSNNFYIIQQYCEGDNLRKLLHRYKTLSEADALHCLKCLCLGFTEIAKKGVIHRDLKPQNVLLKENQLKIGDFGFAKKMINHRQLTSTALGTPFYMAPQLLKSQKYSSKCDVWSVGVIYYELLFGTHPWKGQNIYQLVSNIQSTGLYFDSKTSISEESQIFLVQTLQVNQKQRLSWLEVFEHKIWSHLPDQQNEFKQISLQWRQSYTRAAQKLNSLAANIQLQELIAAFLQLQVSTLSFDQFQKVIQWLLNVDEQQDIGTMYQLFDKDCNGVIDFEEFVTSFGFRDGYIESIKVIQQLLEKKCFYQELKNEETFLAKCAELNIPKTIAKNAFLLIPNIQF